jgi:hypothetical protein
MRVVAFGPPEQCVGADTRCLARVLRRCEIIGAFNKSRELVFTHARYIYGEIAVIKDGNLPLPIRPPRAYTTHDTHDTHDVQMTHTHTHETIPGVWSGKPDDTFGQFECWEKADFRWIAQGLLAPFCPHRLQTDPTPTHIINNNNHNK